MTVGEIKEELSTWPDSLSIELFLYRDDPTDLAIKLWCGWEAMYLAPSARKEHRG